MKEIALNILDIAENSVSGGAGRIRVGIQLDQESSLLKVSIEDNGRGMDGSELALTADPFYTTRTTRKVGLGIPLLRQHAEMAGGKLEIQSVPGKGTRVEASFQEDHPDRQPLGDLEGCWLMLINSYPDIEWILELHSKWGGFSISTSEIKTELEIEVIRGAELTDYLKRLIRNNMDALGFK